MPCTAEKNRLPTRLEFPKQLVSMWLSGRRAISLAEWLKIQDLIRHSKKPSAEGNEGKRMIDTIKSFKYAEPFEPFDIELSSGRVLHVETPDHIAFAELPQGRLAVLNDDGTSLIGSILHVVNVGHLPPAKSGQEET